VGVDTVHSNSKFRANNISKTRFGKVQKCTFFSSYVQRYPRPDQDWEILSDPR
jgi:hypothetical protein